MAVSETEIFALRRFRNYYDRHPLKGPQRIAMREFGFGSWEEKITTRHRSFKNEQELNGFLSRNAPFYISYSAATYHYPSAWPIEKKEWAGAELIFDIDANEIGLPCTQRHGKGWVCESCMDATKASALRLINEFLVDFLGADKNMMEVNFSGNRGYHIHVWGFEDLGREARQQIADYVNGRGIEWTNLFKNDGGRVIGPVPTDGGWKGKFARVFVEKLRARRLEELGIHQKTADKFYSPVIERAIKEGNWEKVYISDRKKFFTNLIDVITNKYGCNVDEGVTRDTSKLIRLPDSLHGETGLVAKRMGIEKLERFNPFSDPVVFGDNLVKVHVKNCDQFKLKGTWGPYKNEDVELPEYAAIYILCKKVAEISPS
jgi:DNA primase small subunit